MRRRFFISNFRKSLLLGAVILCAVWAAVIWLDAPSPTFFGNRVVAQKYADLWRLERNANVELVVVGHSHAAVGLNPSELHRESGLTTYNLAIPSTDLRVQSAMVRDFAVPLVQPRTILWHIGPRLRTVFENQRQILNSPAFQLQRSGGWRYLLRPARWWFPYQKRSVVGWLEAITNPRDRRYDRLGFVAAHATYRATAPDPSLERLRRRRRGWRFPLHPAVPLADRSRNRRLLSNSEWEDLWSQFASALDAADAAGIRVWLYSSPQHQDNYRPGGPLAALIREDPPREEVQRLTRMLQDRALPFANLRYYPPISDHDRFFFDATHLNRQGAIDLTRLIAATLFADPSTIPSAPPEVFSSKERRAVFALSDPHDAP